MLSRKFGHRLLINVINDKVTGRASPVVEGTGGMGWDGMGEGKVSIYQSACVDDVEKVYVVRSLRLRSLFLHRVRGRQAIAYCCISREDPLLIGR